jgi:SAM-dependent methyltransferase
MAVPGFKHRLWKLATTAAPLPTFIRARTSDYWQSHWREKSGRGHESYLQRTELKKWLAKQIVALSPESVLELGCNVGGNLREIADIAPSIKLSGIELNEEAIAIGQREVLPPGAEVFQGSMADASTLFTGRADVVFSSAATMHCEDEIFAAARNAALSIARKAIVHLEYHAWTPADLYNGRQWRSSFLSDRWIRDYIGEYEGHPRVTKIEARAIPMKINRSDTIGRLMVSDTTGLVVIHLKQDT